MTETNAPRTVTEATIGAVASTAGLGVARCKHWRAGMHNSDDPCPHCEVDALRAKLRAANSAAHSLAAGLCGIGEVAAKDGFDLIRRESVMDLVTRWRRQWDAAMATPNPKISGA